MIVDIHVHALGRGDRDILGEITRQCRINGVSVALISLGGSTAAYPESEVVVRANDIAAKFVEDSNGLGRFLAYLSPQDPRWRDELDRCVNDLGAIGVKILNSFRDEAGSFDNAVKVIREAGRRGLPVLMHTFQPTDGNPPGNITIIDFAYLAEACPDTQVIAAHAGGNWRHSLGVLRDRLPNAHVDCCGYYPERMLVDSLVADLGPERVLFGSDLIGRTQASQKAKVVFADIPEGDKGLVLGGNAARLFGIEDVPPGPALPLRPLEELPDFAVEHFCFVGDWPYYEGPWVTAEGLDDLLGKAGIETAYTGSFATLFRQDLERANNSFLEAASGCRRIAPLATLSPLATNWRSTLRLLRNGFAGVIVFPHMHNWRLDASEHADFFRALADAGLPVWINCQLADDRARHTGLASRPVKGEEVVSFCQSAPSNDYVLQGLHGQVAGRALEAAADGGRLRFDASKLTDGSYAWDGFVGKYGLSNLVMGSEFPLRHIEEVRWTARRI
jgi:predicted TIM-barrel fold metal-dependent hydrolase